MAAEAASFSTEIFSTSAGLTSPIAPGAPSMMTSGELSFIEVMPRMRMVALAPGAELVLVTVTPGKAP